MVRTLLIAFIPLSQWQLVRGFVAPLSRALLIVAGISALALPAVADPSSIIEREIRRRAENTRQAQQAIIDGDKAYRLANYAKAVENYTKAHDLLPGGMKTGELRAAVAERLAQAAVERARQLAKNGEVQKADSLLESVLAASVAPNYAPAHQMREQIHDPIRFNPALTPEHVRHVDQVRRLLYEAQGFTELAQFDRSIMMFEEVLRIDPYNTAARRGMETAQGHKRQYFTTARDEIRAALLAETSAAWESAVPKPVLVFDSRLGLVRRTLPGGGASASEKLASIIVPVVDLDQVGLLEAVDYLRQQSINLDDFELVQNRKGVAFIVELGTGDPERTRRIEQFRFNLKLRNIPLEKLLELITEATGTTARVDEYAVVIRPAGAVGDDLVSRQFRVPPDFLSRESLGTDGDEADPFGDDTPERGLVPRLTAQEYLRKQGVAFPPGASANFAPSTSVLSVRNTRTQMALVEVIVEAIVDAEPIMITVEARIIRSTQIRLEELGFDWLLGAPRLTNELFLGGGTVGNGTPIAASTLRPITSGLRSGNLATETNSIDAAINRSPADDVFLRAPGSITAFGLIDNQVVAALMRGVHQHTGIDLVTKKTVITRSGQTATIESVNEFIYPTEYEPPEIPNAVGGGTFIDLATGQAGQNRATTPITPAHPTAFETTNLGCSMEVLAQVGQNGKVIEVSIIPEIRDFDGFIDYGTPITGGNSSASFGAFGGVLTGGNFGIITENNILMPVISTIRGNTTLSIVDGETVVLGGLLKESRIKVEDRVPLLGSLPFIGRLFRSESDTSVRQAYIILVTVRLQDPAGEPVNSR